MARFALVLGGGGVTGIAWETGLLHGLREVGVDLVGADLLIGTSAGSVVGAQLATGLRPDALFAGQVAPQVTAPAQAPTVDLSALFALFANRPPQTAPLTPELCAQVGRAALAAPTGAEEDFLAAIDALLPRQEWPERDLLLTAIDAQDGRFVTWGKESGVALVRAVASSCAVPAVYPPITVAGRRYIDGGIRSGTNADLAAGYPLVVIVAPLAGTAATRGVLDGEVAALRAADSRVEVIWPDEPALTAIGVNPLDPTRRAAAAEAGRAQAAVVAERLRAALAAV